MAGAGARMRRIAPGAYDDGRGGLHIDVRELLEANGWPDTPANRETVERAARELATAQRLRLVVTADK